MDWQKFIQNLIDTKNKFLADVNTAVKPLPPIEQHEATTVVGYALRDINTAIQWITNTCMQMDSQVKDYIERGQQILADMNKAFVDEQISKGELIPKAKIESGDYLSKEAAQGVADAAAQKAAEERETLVRTEIKLLASRRLELSTPKMEDPSKVASGAQPKEIEPALLSREIVDKLPDELIKGDDYKEKATLVANRLKDINALGVPVPQLLSRASELALDDAGEAQFREQLSMIKGAVDSVGGSPKPRLAPAPLASRSDAMPDLSGCF